MPLVSKTFDQLLDFTRTSSATFVGSDGLIQNTPASRNLLTFTQQFDNAAWQKAGATVTANTTVAPDSTNTADKLVEDTSNGLHRVFQTATVAAAPYTFSFYAKSAGRDWIYINVAGALFTAFVNVATGAIGATVGSPTVTMTDVGNGWYRAAITFQPASAGASNQQIWLASNSTTNSYTGDGTSGIFVWGAQLEAASAATTYTRNNGGVFPPRFDYDPVTLAAKGLLSEEQRTNLALYSEQFDNVNWTKGNATVTANATVSPDGASDGDALVEDANTGGHFLQQFLSFTSGTAYTISLYVKAGTRAWMSYGFPASAFGVSTGGFFDLSGAGAIGNANGTPTSRTITAVGNGWYRITVTATATATVGGNVVIAAATANGSTSYAGTNGATALSLYGAQLEAGAFATSYIPTIASQVTRTGDSTAIVAPNFAPWFNPSEGTFVVEYSRYQNADAFGVILETKPTSTATADRFAVAATSTADPRMQLYPNGSSVLDTTSTFGVLAVNTVVKGALAYRSGDSAATRNGASPSTSATAFATPAHTSLQIGSTDNGNYGPVTTTQLNGHIRSVRYYPTRLTNAQLQALTA